MTVLGSIFEHSGEMPASPFSTEQSITAPQRTDRQPLFVAPEVQSPFTQEQALTEEHLVAIEIVPVPLKPAQKHKEYQPDVVRMERNFDNLLRWAFRDEHPELCETSVLHQGGWLVNKLETRTDVNGQDRHYLRGQDGKLYRISKTAYLDIRFFDPNALQNKESLAATVPEPYNKAKLYGNSAVTSFVTSMSLNQPIEQSGRRVSAASEGLGKRLEASVYKTTNQPGALQQNLHVVPSDPNSLRSPERRIWKSRKLGRIAAAAALLFGSIVLTNASENQPALAQDAHRPTLTHQKNSPDFTQDQDIDPSLVLMTWEIDHQRTDGAEAVAAFNAASPETQKQVIDAELEQVMHGRYRYQKFWMRGIIQNILQKLTDANKSRV